MPQNYEDINKHEREIIAEMRGNGKGWDTIGARLGRPGSSVWREYHRNMMSEGKYLPHAAPGALCNSVMYCLSNP